MNEKKTPVLYDQYRCIFIDIGMMRLQHLFFVFCLLDACHASTVDTDNVVVSNSVLYASWQKPAVLLDLKKIIEYLYLNVSSKEKEKINAITGRNWNDDQVKQFKDGVKWLHGCVFKNDQIKRLKAKNEQDVQIPYQYQHACDYMPSSMQESDRIFSSSEWMDWLYVVSVEESKYEEGNTETINKHAEKRSIS